MNRKSLNYVIFFGIVAVVVLLAINHSRHMNGLVNAMAGDNRDARVAAAKELVQAEQFMDSVTGESITKRLRIVQALQDWAAETPPAKPATPVKADPNQPAPPKVWAPKDAVAQLVGFLKDPDQPVRERVTIALMHVGALTDDNLGELCNGIKDGDVNVRKASILTLQVLGQKDDATASQLIPNSLAKRAVGSDDLVAAAKSLRSEMKPEVCANIVTKVIALIKADGGARGPGGDLLGNLPEQREASVKGLLPLLDDKDEGVRSGAADVLGKVGSKTAVPDLIRVMAKDTAQVRRVAIGAIALIADPSGQDALVEAINNPNDDNEARAQAASGLGKIGTPVAINTLIKALSDYDLKVQLAAVAGLARAGKPAIPALTATLTTPKPERRVLAAKALGGIQASEANGALIAALNDKDQQVRVAAATALGFANNAGAVDALVAQLGNADGAVATAAADALGKIGKPGREKLALALASPNKDIAYFAARALGQQGSEAVEAIRRVGAQSAGARPWAVAALGSIGGAQATELLKEYKQTGDPATRDVAVQALKQIGAE